MSADETQNVELGLERCPEAEVRRSGSRRAAAGLSVIASDGERLTLVDTELGPEAVDVMVRPG